MKVHFYSTKYLIIIIFTFFCFQVSETFQIIDQWFDLFNTQVPRTTKCLAYGLDKDNQDDILQKMDKLMLTMRVYQSKSPRKTLMPFQKGILMSNNSLRNLFADMKEMYNIKYIRSSKGFRAR